MKKTLNEVYGPDQVGMVNATLRWFNHHSQMKAEYNGECYRAVQLWTKWRWYHIISMIVCVCVCVTEGHHK